MTQRPAIAFFTRPDTTLGVESFTFEHCEGVENARLIERWGAGHYGMCHACFDPCDDWSDHPHLLDKPKDNPNA